MANIDLNILPNEAINQKNDTTKHVAWARGDSTTRTFKIIDDAGAAVNVSAYTQIKMTVNSLFDPADNSTQQFEIIGDIASGGASGLVTFTPTTTQTNILADTYFYDIQAEDGSNVISTLIKSKVHIIQDISKTVSGVSTPDAGVITLLIGDSIDNGATNSIKVGDGGDLKIYHQGNHSYIAESGSGNLRLQANDLLLEDVSGNKFLKGSAGGTVQIWHNAAGHPAAKLTTSATGVEINGTVTADSYIIDDGTFKTTIVENASSDITLTLPSSTGTLATLADVQAEDTLAEMNDVNLTSPTDGSFLQYDNASSKWVDTQTIVETASGVNVTGTVTADGGTIDGTLQVTKGNGLHIGDATTSGGGLQIFQESNNKHTKIRDVGAGHDNGSLYIQANQLHLENENGSKKYMRAFDDSLVLYDAGGNANSNIAFRTQPNDVTVYQRAVRFGDAESGTNDAGTNYTRIIQSGSANADTTLTLPITTGNLLVDDGSGNVDVTGNITVTGNVDGQDVADIGSKATTAHGWGNHASAGYLTSFTETNDLSAAVTWANVPDANITQGSVTQHQSALTITESQISNLGSYLTSFTETNDLSAAVTWSNVPDTNITQSSVTQHQAAITAVGTLSALNVNGTVTATGLSVDVSGGYASIQSNDDTSGLILKSTHTGNDSSPDLLLRRTVMPNGITAPASYSLHAIQFEGLSQNPSDASDTTNSHYVRLLSEALNSTKGAPEGQFKVEVATGSGNADRLKVNKDGIDVIGTVTADAYTGSQTISNYVTDTAIDATEFAGYAGKKIIYTGAASTISLPNATAADIGKTWTILNAGTGAITIDVDASGTAQQVRHLHAGGVNTSTTDRTIAIGGVVEIICIAEDNGGITNSSTKPNYAIYGGGVI